MAGADGLGEAGPSSTPDVRKKGKGPAATRSKRRQGRLSVHSPYPSATSPRTPQRTPARKARGSTIVDEVVRSPTTPQTPSMRALNAIVSFISPFSSAKRSAAFGIPSREEEEEEDVEDEDDVASQLYPALPSSPAAVPSSSIQGDDPDEVVSGPEAESEDAGDATILVDETMEEEKHDAFASPEIEVVPVETIDVVEAEPHEIEPEIEPLVEEPITPLFGRTEMARDLSQVDVTSIGRSEAASTSQPQKRTFEAFAGDSAGPFSDTARSYREGSQPHSAKRFTFGEGARNAPPHFPSYPRPARPARNFSPLVKNYDLLSRFFAEKAEQEARAAEGGASSVMSMDEDGAGIGGLTEVELAGCMRLIEQSFAHGQGAEIERLRREALARGRLQEESVHSATYRAAMPDASGSAYREERTMSRSPSLPLGAAAGESLAGLGESGYGIRASTSFLAPSRKWTPEDASLNQNLLSAFHRPTSAPAQRRHRPLYLGPGMGAKSTSALRRQQQQLHSRRSVMSTHRTALQGTPANDTQNKDMDDSAQEAPTKRRRLPGERSDAPALFTQPPEPIEVASAQSTKKQAVGNKSRAQPAAAAAAAAAPPPQISQTADAMLSILRSGPSIPIRTSAMLARSRNDSEADSTSSITNPDIVNPYERETRLSRRSRASTSNSSLAAKEKERLREEREKRQKAMKEREARKESTLEFLQRTAPPPTRTRLGARTARRIAFDEEDAEMDNDEEEEEEEEEGSAATPAKAVHKAADVIPKKVVETATAEKTKKADEAEGERRRKNEELKRRTEELLLKSKASAAVKDSGSASSASPVSTLKPSPFGVAFAPKKPSPLSQAASNIVPGSPSGSSETSERDASRFAPSPPKPATRANAVETVVLDDSDEGENSKDSSSTASTTPAFSFGQSNSKAPFSAPSPFTAQKPLSNGAASASAVPSSVSEKIPGTKPLPQDQVRSEPVSAMPKFDFALNVVLPSNSQTGTQEEARKKVLALASTELPTFDLVGGSPSSHAVPSEPVSAKPAFSFKAVPASSPPKTTGTDSTPAPAAGSTSTATTATDKNASALLSGTGEGEEDEESEHEVRCKVWSLAEGKWNDLGIGMLRIKRHKSSAKQRVLVRNEGNGKVTVNFSLLPTFKANLDKTVVTFLGFDQTGKPTNFRVKIKTEAGAAELKTALEKSVATLQ